MFPCSRKDVNKAKKSLKSEKIFNISMHCQWVVFDFLCLRDVSFGSDFRSGGKSLTREPQVLSNAHLDTVRPFYGATNV